MNDIWSKLIEFCSVFDPPCNRMAIGQVRILNYLVRHERTLVVEV